MGDIVRDTTVSLTGRGSFIVGDETFVWKNSYLDLVDFYSETPTLKVNISLSGNWDIGLLTFNSDQPLDVRITDTDLEERYITFLELGSSGKGTSSYLELRNTSVDVIKGGGGSDKIYLGTGYFTSIDLSSGHDELDTGRAVVDFIRGGDGNDIVASGSNYTGQINLLSGNDAFVFKAKSNDSFLTMVNGGSGVDILSLEGLSSKDVFSLSETGAQDTGAGYIIAVGFEDLSGSARSDRLEGDAGRNRIYGHNGNDELNGLSGIDNLSGGGGRDKFIFNTKLGTQNVDYIADYDVALDTIVLENAIFDSLRSGKISSASFTSNTSGRATDASDRIIYERDSGKLWYDKNGSAAGGAILFATLDANLKLTAADFLII